MPRFTTLLLTLATLSATSLAQAPDAAGPANSPYMQSQPAPIQRAAPNRNFRAPAQTTISRPALGIIVRSARNSSVRTVSADAHRTELTVERGISNVSVRHPQSGMEILVNLPGGQTSLLKDGLYTFNADTNTVRVLKGEAKTFPTPDSKGIKVKEDHQVAFGNAPIRSVELDPLQARADLLPSNAPRTEGFRNDGPYYGGEYDGFYGYPYGYYGYPYYGYGFGLGFGYYRGFGGFHGGFHGHR